jgi:hypothetical protein
MSLVVTALVEESTGKTSQPWQSGGHVPVPWTTGSGGLEEVEDGLHSDNKGEHRSKSRPRIGNGVGTGRPRTRVKMDEEPSGQKVASAELMSKITWAAAVVQEAALWRKHRRWKEGNWVTTH